MILGSLTWLNEVKKMKKKKENEMIFFALILFIMDYLIQLTHAFVIVEYLFIKHRLQNTNQFLLCLSHEYKPSIRETYITSSSCL